MEAFWLCLNYPLQAHVGWSLVGSLLLMFFLIFLYMYCVFCLVCVFCPIYVACVSEWIVHSWLTFWFSLIVFIHTIMRNLVNNKVVPLILAPKRHPIHFVFQILRTFEFKSLKIHTYMLNKIVSLLVLSYVWEMILWPLF